MTFKEFRDILERRIAHEHEEAHRDHQTGYYERMAQHIGAAYAYEQIRKDLDEISHGKLYKHEKTEI